MCKYVLFGSAGFGERIHNGNRLVRRSKNTLWTEMEETNINENEMWIVRRAHCVGVKTDDSRNNFCCANAQSNASHVVR